MTAGRGRAIPTRGSRSRASADEIVDAAARQPHGRLPVHEVHGRGDGRRHGRGRCSSRRTSAPTRSACPPTGASTSRGWCYATDPVLVAEHPDLWRSPAMAAAARRGARAARASASTTSRHLDLYSCFASSLHFACDALGIAADDPRGAHRHRRAAVPRRPGSGYLTHSIAAMVERAARRPGRVRAGQRRRHAHDEARVRRVLDGARRRSRRPTQPRSSAPLDATPPVPVVAEHDGDATVAAYSVVHGRDGAPEWPLLVCDSAPPARARTYARLDDPDRAAAVGGARARRLPGGADAPTTVAGPDGSTPVSTSRSVD